VAGVRRGYHKPIMIAGGLGSIAPARRTSAFRRRHAAGAAGRAGHAHRHGRRRRQLDGRRQQHRGAGLRQVQRGNPEIQRRAQEVINHCWALGEATPSWPSTTSAPAASATPSPSWWTAPARAPRFDLRKVPLEEIRPGAEGDLVQREPGALRAGRRPRPAAAVQQMCERERCPFAVVGVATDAPQLVLEDGPGGERPIDMPMDVLLGKPPKMHRDVQRVARTEAPLDLTGVKLEQVAFDVLRHPTVASKRFLSPSATAPWAA
jgi:phosphoribosylformylglycinamidine synthase